ncbi:4802_t:CDS:1 [Funneliformis mosseae]|uniref:4802_t:CDS:1 n=1 Tax=Funneliformis mosseae TaxID=27381 RepID=A0A9N9GVD8_FUNMO|nr:4802_t:CDS:1 [Funneliformis mosseae]
MPDDHPLEIMNTNVYLLDLRTFTWVNSFNPTNLSPTIIINPMNTTSSVQITETSSIASNNSLNPNNLLDPFEEYQQLTTLKVVVGTISGIFGTAFLMTVGFLIYRWDKKRIKSETLNIPGSTDNYYQPYLYRQNTVVPVLNRYT